MTKKILFGIGSVILLTSTLSARDVSYDRDYDYKDYKKSHKQVKRHYNNRSYDRDSRYLSRADKREMIRMREIKRERMQEKRKRLAAKQRKLQRQERILEARRAELRRQQARNRHHYDRRYEVRNRHRHNEINRVSTIINLATLPLIIHDMHMRELAMVRDRF